MAAMQLLSRRRALISTILLAFVFVSFALVLFGFTSNTLLPSLPSQLRSVLLRPADPPTIDLASPPAISPLAAPAPEHEELERVLAAADMGNRTVILTTLNAAWAEPGSVLDLFFEGFRVGNGTSELLKHLVIITTDRKAFERCASAAHSHCFNLDIAEKDFSAEQVFNTVDYLDMMWRRLDLLRLILEKGYSFVFTDTDILWLRNPLPHLYADGDFQISCDRFFGNATSLENLPSNGFIYVKSANRTVAFYKYWYSLRDKYPGKNEQDVFSYIIDDRRSLRKLGLRIMFLDTKYFSGLCERSRDMNLICTMHVNCRVGLKSKLKELRAVLDAWRKYISGLHYN
ncbi:hypothetical protein Cni_G14711 [Canna indica]|uniref:Nucleotide-diphospho-sugar transferase domain-containing protein n=1 Tax=Canna indica TaxID=4628 RepID=A0AAQ3KCJ5_9LILI|nr:hypothetical protein Cni_G14711 [Canna indica]